MATLDRPRRFATREEFLVGGATAGRGPSGNGDGNGDTQYRQMRPVRRWTVSETPGFLITYAAGASLVPRPSPPPFRPSQCLTRILTCSSCVNCRVPRQNQAQKAHHEVLAPGVQAEGRLRPGRARISVRLLLQGTVAAYCEAQSNASSGATAHTPGGVRHWSISDAVSLQDSLLRGRVQLDFPSQRLDYRSAPSCAVAAHMPDVSVSHTPIMLHMWARS